MASQNIRVRPWTILLVVLAILFVIAGIVYVTHTAAGLPSFFPGHDAHSKTHHYKHAAGMFTLAVVALIGAWMTTGPSKDAERSTPAQ